MRLPWRDGAYGDGLATWIADVLAELVRRAVSPDRAVWEQVITNLEAAVERVDLILTLISRWEIMTEQPFTEMVLLELIDGVRLFAPPLALARPLDAFLKRELMAVIDSGSTTLQRQMPRIMMTLLDVREQLSGVHTALLGCGQGVDIKSYGATRGLDHQPQPVVLGR